MTKNFKPAAVAAARAAADKKAPRISLRKVGDISPITDYALVVTALSRPHLETLELAVERALEELGLACLRRARPKSDQWRVLDFGGLLVHIMTEESREFYAIDELYGKSADVAWEKKMSIKSAK